MPLRGKGRGSHSEDSLEHLSIFWLNAPFVIIGSLTGSANHVLINPLGV